MNDYPIREAMQQWAEAFSSETPDDILNLYADEAVLWGTLSAARSDTPEALRAYFEQIFTFGKREVRFYDPLIRQYGPVMINSGSYTFFWNRNGVDETVESRYSMVYVERDGEWLIVDHHSSRKP